MLNKPRWRLASGTSESAFYVGNRVSALRSVTVLSQGAREVELRLDASGLLTDLRQKRGRKDDERYPARRAFTRLAHGANRSRVRLTESVTVASAEQPGFDELVDLLRERLGHADALNRSEMHSFKELMKDHAKVIGDN